MRAVANGKFVAAGGNLVLFERAYTYIGVFILQGLLGVFFSGRHKLEGF